MRPVDAHRGAFPTVVKGCYRPCKNATCGAPPSMARQGETRRSGGHVVRVLFIVAIAAGLLLGSFSFLTVADSQEAGTTPGGMTEMSAGLVEMSEDRPMVSDLDGESFGAFVFLATYSKYNDVSPLEHEMRSEILGIVGAAPGIYFAHLVGRTDRPASTVRYHTKILEREGELQTEQILGHLRLFTSGVPSSAFAYLAAKRDPATSRVIECVEETDGPINAGTLSDAIDRAPSTVSYHLARLEEESLITRERTGEGVQITLSEQVKRLKFDPSARKADAD